MYIACQKELNAIYKVLETVNGKGVFATKDIPPQTILMRVTGDVLDFASTKHLGKYESYTLQIEMDKYILTNPPFRYVNHCCLPNTALDADLFLYSIKAIKAGEQICWDYSTSMLERSWTMKCSCGAPHCRGLITDFDLLPRELQHQYLRLGIVLPFIANRIKKAV